MLIDKYHESFSVHYYKENDYYLTIDSDFLISHLAEED